jgi:hypothetical protein
MRGKGDRVCVCVCVYVSPGVCVCVCMRGEGDRVYGCVCMGVSDEQEGVSMIVCVGGCAFKPLYYAV